MLNREVVSTYYMSIHSYFPLLLHRPPLKYFGLRLQKRIGAIDFFHGDLYDVRIWFRPYLLLCSDEIHRITLNAKSHGEIRIQVQIQYRSSIEYVTSTDKTF